jgi:hypothetical protein
METEKSIRLFRSSSNILAILVTVEYSLNIYLYEAALTLDCRVEFQ